MWYFDKMKRTDQDALGPLLMHVDILDKEHAKLAEQAFSEKIVFCFISLTFAARDELNAHLHETKARGPSNYHYAGKGYTPRQRPPAADLKRFGITAWLDEALTIPPEYATSVLGCLKELMNVDTFLLGTRQTMGVIDQLREYLAKHGISNVTICTPERTYRSSRSQYGNKALNMSSTVPRKVNGIFSSGLDPEEEKAAKASVEQAAYQLDEHKERRAELEARLGEKKGAHHHASIRRKEVGDLANRIKGFKQRLGAFTTKLQQAVAAVDAFDADAKKAEYRKQLQELYGRTVRDYESMAGIIQKQVDAFVKTSGARLAHKAADNELAEATEQLQELDAKIEQGKRDCASIKARVKELGDEASDVEKKATEKAPKLEPGKRDAAHDEVWSGMPDDGEKLEEEIELLEAETQGEVGDENSVKQFQARTEKIAAVRAKLAAIDSDCESKEVALRGLEAEWKPKLQEMVKIVDQNFSAYFNRFRCVGEVCLSDGRKLDAAGQPTGEDDYSQYKIHIKVQWRSNEQLHILGEEGRDSGGERSVATMIYLISLQNVNHAPFRVVDEINQAMDSTNERNVFECITHACRDGGKQYFLLTPKLLPDLEYGENTTVQLVYNGPYNVQRDSFNLEKYC